MNDIRKRQERLVDMILQLYNNNVDKAEGFLEGYLFCLECNQKADCLASEIESVIKKYKASITQEYAIEAVNNYINKYCSANGERKENEK